jgi:methionyl-tRNA formyltransferase
MQQQNIVFMGTPDFAVPCLAAILQAGHAVKGVFCQPDRPRGRGQKPAYPPVKVLAAQHNLPVFQPETLRDEAVTAQLRALAPDLIVVVAYGKILPAEILALPPLGCVNIHASLLPHLRGAAPIQWSVLGGDTETGVTSMYMAKGMDTGDVILQRKTPIGAEETAGELFGRLSALGADCLSETIPLLASGRAPRTPQDPAQVSYAPMITKEMAVLDFALPASTIINWVRGMNPAPMARTLYNGQLLKVLKAAAAPGEYAGAPGELLDRKRLIVGCADGAVELLCVQPQGKKEMSGAAFLNGYRLTPGDRFGG